MGNYISCTLLAPTGKHSAVRVILPTGEIKKLSQPVKAAELMLDTPNFFLVNSLSLQIGRRFSALNADEDLEISNVYIMFSMKRLNSVVTAADMAPLFVAANSAAKRVQISPESALPKLNLDDMEELSTLGYRHKLSMAKSKKPLLETIAE